MLKKYKKYVLGCAFFCALFLLFSTSILQAQETIYELDNGMKVILKESHGSPMIASMVFVESGSKYESEYENGITHFLEHLLFDGTINQTREELDKSIRDLGGYINAFTRQEMTAYLVLLPKQYIDYGMTVQTDMLFNSLIPEEELPKERKVVIEEINRDKDSPTFASEKFFIEKAYATTPYNRPVLGYKGFIENIPREAIVDYWKRFYRPENMTALIIGDFKTDEMKETVANIFGSINLPVVDPTTPKKDFSSYEYEITGQNRFDTTAKVETSHINFSINAPHFNDSSYFAFDLLSQYLAMDDVSPLMNALKRGDDALATEASVYLNNYTEFSRLEISVETDKPENKGKIVDIVLSELAALPDFNADNEVIDGIKTSVKTDYIYNSEKLHYLGFILGKDIMTCGYDFVKNYPTNLSNVSWDDCRSAAAKYLLHPNYVVTTVVPTKEDEVGFVPYEISAEEVIAHFDSTKFPEYNVDSGLALTFPQTDSVSFKLVDNATYEKISYDNGLTAIIKHNPTSEIFALNVIGKNRTVNEPDGKAGITDFVNRCIEKGTVTRNAAELSRDLSKIGANVTLFDNPWIPYDDRYTSRSYSFMKFETIDEFAELGFHLFSDMILLPAFDEAEIENIRRSMIGMLGRDSGSPSKIARNMFYENLFDNSYANPVSGTPMTIGSITKDDLVEHHQRFYAPENMIISIVSNRPIEEIKKWLDLRFGQLNKRNYTYNKPEPPKPIFETVSTHEQIEGKEQVSIYLGSSIPGYSNPDVTGIKTAASILSTRMYLNLREKQGLAYSVGTGVRFDYDFGLCYTTIGTQSANYQQAVDGINLQINKLKLDGPDMEEIKTAKNQLWGRLMSSKLSSINQAYYLGLNEFYHLPIDYDAKMLESLTSINIEEIRRITSKYFKTDAYVMTSAGMKN